MSRRERRAFRAQAKSYLRRDAADVVESAATWLGSLALLSHTTAAERFRMVVDLRADDRVVFATVADDPDFVRLTERDGSELSIFTILLALAKL